MEFILIILVSILVTLIWTAVAAILWMIHFNEYTHIEQIKRDHDRYLAIFLGGPVVWLFYLEYLYRKHVK